MNTLSVTALLRWDISRYFAASLLALVVDVGVLSACLRLLHLNLTWSASIGFAAGAIVAYILSIRWVFRNRALGSAPLLEFATFIGIGIAGLGVTHGVLWLGVGAFDLMPELVKLAAAVATFTFNYIVRKTLLFASRRRAMAASESIA